MPMDKSLKLIIFWSQECTPECTRDCTCRLQIAIVPKYQDLKTSNNTQFSSDHKRLKTYLLR